jgi:hypothetical protein
VNQKKAKGEVVTPFDTVIRITRPMGIHYQNWEEPIIEIEKGNARLIPGPSGAIRCWAVAQAGSLRH